MVVRVTIFALSIALLVSCEGEGPRWPETTRTARVEIAMAPRTPHIPSHPCGPQCHDARTANVLRRELREMHTRIRLDHGSAVNWCDFCHRIEHPDDLRLMDGTPISFDESHRLCAQCHGERARDHQAGIHGLQTGSWNGTARRRLCTACHDPHAPGEIRLTALPPPRTETSPEATP